MPDTLFKNWIAVLPVGRDMVAVDVEGNHSVKFSLGYYTVVNGAFRYVMTVDGKEIEGGMHSVNLNSKVSIRPHSPIELIQVVGSGYSPKMVYRLPKQYRIQQYKEELKESFYDKARKHQMREL